MRLDKSSLRVVAQVLLSCMVVTAAVAASRVSLWCEDLQERCICCADRSWDGDDCDDDECGVECLAEAESEAPVSIDSLLGSANSDRERIQHINADRNDNGEAGRRAVAMSRGADSDQRHVALRTDSERLQSTQDTHVPTNLLETSPEYCRIAPINEEHEESPAVLLRRRLAAIQPKVDTRRSPSSGSSSACSSDASSSSWEETHRHILVENAALRKRLEQTPPRVYDSTVGPSLRHMNNQQLRRVAILHHRDELHADSINTHQRNDTKPQWR